jgi:hypothetical protein
VGRRADARCEGRIRDEHLRGFGQQQRRLSDDAVVTKSTAAKGPIDATVETFSDAASMVVFDPRVCAGRGAPSLARLRRLTKEGKAAWFGLVGDMAYRVRVTDGDLTALERACSRRPPVELGLEVASGRIYVSGNDLPGLSTDDYETGVGDFVAVPKGRYRVSAHVEAPGRRTKALRELPDFVLVLTPEKRKMAFIPEKRKNPFTGKMEELLPPQLFD